MLPPPCGTTFFLILLFACATIPAPALIRRLRFTLRLVFRSSRLRFFLLSADVHAAADMLDLHFRLRPRLVWRRGGRAARRDEVDSGGPPRFALPRRADAASLRADMPPP